MNSLSNEKIAWYIKCFNEFEKKLNGESTKELNSLRKKAISQFSNIGFPTHKDEEWKYTDISPLFKFQFKPTTDNLLNENICNRIKNHPILNLDGELLVFVDGYFSKELSRKSSKMEDVFLGSLSDAMHSKPEILYKYLSRYVQYDQNAFVSLNTAFISDGAVIYIPQNIKFNLPIHMLFVSTQFETEFVTHPRNLIVVEDNSQVNLTETYFGLFDNIYFTNAVTEIILGENADVEHVRVQNESKNSFHIATVQAYQNRNANFVSNSLTFGGSLVRNNITSVLGAEGGQCKLYGLYIGTGSQHIDNHTTIDHTKPRCNSYEMYKGILDGNSNGVFNGKIIVRPDAQLTNAIQNNRNLILSDEASVNAKPQLEIFANDVKCTHGATIGQLDEEAMYYLRTRGIGKKAAKDLLLYAFASEIVEQVSNSSLKNELQSIVFRQLHEITNEDGKR